MGRRSRVGLSPPQQMQLPRAQASSCFCLSAAADRRLAPHIAPGRSFSLSPCARASLAESCASTPRALPAGASVQTMGLPGERRVSLSLTQSLTRQPASRWHAGREGGVWLPAAAAEPAGGRGGQREGGRVSERGGEDGQASEARREGGAPAVVTRLGETCYRSLPVKRRRCY